MAASTSGGADTLRAGAAALDHLADLVARRDQLEHQITEAARTALTLPGVTQEHVAPILGIRPRQLRNRLAEPAHGDA